jgi:hypothetical protein
MQRIFKIIMNKKPFFFLLLMLVLIPAGCIKEKYDMNKLSDKMKFSPTLLMSAVTGNISLKDMVKSNDTIRYDNDNFVRIIFRKNSVIDLKLKDFYDLDNMVSFSQGYKIGDLKLGDFQTTMPITLNTISSSLSPALRALLGSLDDGITHNFPSLPETDIGEKVFSLLPNFQNAVFSGGLLEISVKNNLTAPLSNIKISLFNSSGHTPIGSQLTIPPIAPGATQSATLDLTGRTVTNSIIAAIVLTGSPGTSTPVLINLNSTVQVGIRAYNLKVQSGRVILPPQTISTLDNVDTILLNPGSNVEIEKLKIKSGTLGYTLISNSSISGSYSITLPTALKSNGSPVTETVQINGNTNITSSILINNTEVDLSTISSQRFNMVPVNYSISVSSNGGLINFNMEDNIQVNINMLNPVLDYVKGYFGQMSHQTNDTDILDTGLDEIMSNITGQVHISNPSIKLIYSNSFGIPIDVTLNVAGKRNSQTVDLLLAPFSILYPASLSVNSVTSSFTINKTNSSLPDLISLLPTEITFAGSAKMNPTGPPAGGRNNFVYGDSRFLGDLEVEVPLELRISDLQFSDTLDNFLKPDNNNNSSFKVEDMDSLRVNIVANNGFPLGVSVKMLLYDSGKRAVVKTIDATNLLQPALVDANGKSTGKTESSTTIEFKKDFFDAINSANKIIFMFILNTTDNGTKDVKIYSDYSISFKASMVVKPNINL